MDKAHRFIATLSALTIACSLSVGCATSSADSPRAKEDAVASPEVAAGDGGAMAADRAPAAAPQAAAAPLPGSGDNPIAPDPASAKPKLPEYKTRATCEAGSGKWSWPGMPRPGEPNDSEGFCLLSTGDAGQPCTSSNECEGSCEAQADSATTHKGRCSAKNTRTGCRAYVENGTPTAVICTD
jgi:hypothetical protein